MKDPDRLGDASPDEFERALLASAKQDVGSERALLRSLAAMGAAGLVSKGAAASVTSGVLMSAAKFTGLGIAVGLVVAVAQPGVRHSLGWGAAPALSATSTTQASGVRMSKRTTDNAPVSTPAHEVEMQRAPLRGEALLDASQPRANGILGQATLGTRGGSSAGLDALPASRPGASVNSVLGATSAAPAASAAPWGAASEPAPTSAAALVAPPGSVSTTSAARVTASVAALPAIGPSGAASSGAASSRAASSRAAAPAVASSAGGPSAAASSSAAPAAAGPSTSGSERRARDPLAREVSLLDQARAALVRDSGAHALRLLDKYQREFPRGALAPEAIVIRVQALELTGARGKARRLAERALQSLPEGTHAARLKSLLAGMNP